MLKKSVHGLSPLTLSPAQEALDLFLRNTLDKTMNLKAHPILKVIE